MATVLRSLRQKPVPCVLLNRNLQQFFVTTTASNQHKEDAKVEGKPEIFDSLPTYFECKSGKGKGELDDYANVASQLRVIQKMLSPMDTPKSQKDVDAFKKLLEKEPQLLDPISQTDVDVLQKMLDIALNDMRREQKI